MPSKPPDIEAEKEAQREVIQSAVTNGKRFALPGIDLRTSTARRFRDLVQMIQEDRGGVGHLSTGEQQLARRAGLLCLACEAIEGEFISTGEIDHDQYMKLTEVLGRTLVRLGLRRRARDVTTPHLHAYIRQKAANRDT